MNQMLITADDQLMLQQVPFPKDANITGDVFGGWIVSQMDVAGAIRAYQVANSLVKTVAINHFTFLKPIQVGDYVSIYAAIDKKGRSSITMKIKACINRQLIGEQFLCAEGLFTYVAVDKQGVASPVFAEPI